MNMHSPVSARTDEPEYPGRIDYECRNIIRDLIRLYGPDEARAKVANYFEDETRRSRTQ